MLLFQNGSPSMLILLLFSSMICLDLGVKSFSFTSLTQPLTPRRSHATKRFPLYSENGHHIIEALENDKKSRGIIQKAKGLVLTTGLISALLIAPPLGTVIPPANAVSTSRLSTIEVVASMSPSSSNSLSLASTTETQDSATTAMMVPSSIATSGMPRVASIMDLAGVLDPQKEVPKLVQAIQQAERKTQTELQIVIVHQVQKGYTPKQMATTLFNQWRLGTAQKNNGVLILVVLDERRTEIEVGQALNQAMNAQWCTKVLQENASPAFRNEQYGKGLLATVKKVSQKLQEVDRNGGGIMDKKPKEGSGLLHVDGAALANNIGFSAAVVLIWVVYLDMKYPIKDDCPQCHADKKTWTFADDGGWVVTKEATDQQEGIEELQGVCANCGYVYTKTSTIRRYDGSTVDSDGNTSYYYNDSSSSSSSDSGGSSDGGGGGDSW